jgi:hypothetical protein
MMKDQAWAITSGDSVTSKKHYLVERKLTNESQQLSKVLYPSCLQTTSFRVWDSEASHHVCGTSKTQKHKINNIKSQTYHNQQRGKILQARQHNKSKEFSYKDSFEEAYFWAYAQNSLC